MFTFFSRSSFLILSCGLVFFGAGCWTSSEDAAPAVADSVSCTDAEFQFACYLDRAMIAEDPALCEDVGEQKRIACLHAYQEIMETDIDCGILRDLMFQSECRKEDFQSGDF